MPNSSALSDGAQQANMVSNENAEAMFGADQAETNMVKLVNGRLEPIGDTTDDVMDEQLRNRFSSDEERALQTYDENSEDTTYERSAAALRVGNGFESPDNADTGLRIADADITGNPDAGATVNTGLPSENKEDTTPTAGFWTVNSTMPTRSDMVPPSPSTPDPNNPIPAAPETPQPPTPHEPGPEIPTPTPQPTAPPEIQEPTQPSRSHEINGSAVYDSKTSVTYTSTYFGIELPGKDMPKNNPPADVDEIEPVDVKPGEALPGNQYEGMTPGIGDEGMEEDPETGPSALPYDVNRHIPTNYQASERPQEAAQMQTQPREALDESSSKKADMDEDQSTDPSDTKSTDGLDRHYNDPEAAREMAT